MSITFGSIPAPPAEVVVSQAQLHGEACIRCGNARGLLIPAGFFYTAGADGGQHGWAVVACTQHAGGRA